MIQIKVLQIKKYIMSEVKAQIPEFVSQLPFICHGKLLKLSESQWLPL